MNISPNFKLDEFTSSQYAVRNGIDNTPCEVVLGNLKITALGMEEIRVHLGVPLFITSGYRCPKLNKCVGGSKKSAHVDGYAADFIANKFGKPKTIVEKIKELGIKYDQLICEGTWVHISFAPTLRQQTLTAEFKDGGVTYKEFV